ETDRPSGRTAGTTSTTAASRRGSATRNRWSCASRGARGSWRAGSSWGWRTTWWSLFPEGWRSARATLREGRHERREDRPVDPLRRLRAPRGADPRGGGGRRGLDPRRRDGRALRAEPHHRSADRGGRPALHLPAAGHAPDDRGAGAVPARL